MSDKWTERAVTSVRARHMTKIRALAEDIQRNAEFMLAALDRGRVPYLHTLPGEIQEIAERLQAVAAIDEIDEIYKAEEDP